jgi:hypothetical protein
MLVRMSDTLFFGFMGIGFFAWLLVHGAHRRIDKLTERIEELETKKKLSTTLPHN